MWPYKITLAVLRRECPDWRWRGEKRGMGWQYVGRSPSNDVVIVRAAAYVCGPAEDDYATGWVAEDSQGRVSSYAAWRMAGKETGSERFNR